MAGYNANYVENPAAYEAAISRRIKANANIGRRRKLEAQLDQDGDSAEFRAWLFDTTPPHITELLEASREAQTDEASRRYRAAWTAWTKRVGNLPTALHEALENWGGLTPKQLQWARDAFKRNIDRAENRDAAETERKANAQPWTAGRQEITGIVQSARWEEFGVNRWHSTTSLKGLILLADGRKLWTSIPSRLHPENGAAEAVKGTTVTFKVTIEVSKDDVTMAFGQRPS